MKLAAVSNEFYFCDWWNENSSNIKTHVLCIFCFWKITVMPYMKTVQQISRGMGELKLLKHKLTDVMLSNCLWTLMLTCVLYLETEWRLKLAFQLRTDRKQKYQPKYWNQQMYYGSHHLLTTRSRVLLEKPTGFHPVKKLSAFYWTRRFITALTNARQLSLSWAKSIQSMPPHLTAWRSILILSSHLRLGLQSGLFPSSFSTTTV